MRKSMLLSIAALVCAGAFMVVVRGRGPAPRDPESVVPVNLRETDAYQAMKWYNDQRARPTGHIPAGWREKALREIRANATMAKVAFSAPWTELGPGNIGGRVRSIAIDPVHPDTIYCGSVAGGIW